MKRNKGRGEWKVLHGDHVLLVAFGFLGEQSASLKIVILCSSLGMCEEARDEARQTQTSDGMRFKKDCGPLSSIVADTPDEIQAVIDANLFPTIARAMVEGEAEDQKEAARIVASATRGGTREQLFYLVDVVGVLDPLVVALMACDECVTLDALDAVTNILQAGEYDKNEKSHDHNRFVAMLEENGGVEKIEALQCHQSDTIYNAALTTLETFWLRPTLTAEGAF